MCSDQSTLTQGKSTVSYLCIITSRIVQNPLACLSLRHCLIKSIGQASAMIYLGVSQLYPSPSALFLTYSPSFIISTLQFSYLVVFPISFCAKL
ncbi:hypothetical protein FGO68_gene6485 [Halteria grandinella]|uniref:Uncharacterized protein n=1 Tax=Halteria grandinella TaxID=5974 RepID=A0A8J8T2Z9_HALGN|nr:hypothetical protein FGO68_gene6485 [Halteria grandinella]